jgi:hypothetical protein
MLQYMDNWVSVKVYLYCSTSLHFNILFKLLVVLLHIWVVHSSNLSSDTRYPDRFPWLSIFPSQTLDIQDLKFSQWQYIKSAWTFNHVSVGLVSDISESLRCQQFIWWVLCSHTILKQILPFIPTWAMWGTVNQIVGSVLSQNRPHVGELVYCQNSCCQSQTFSPLPLSSLFWLVMFVARYTIHSLVLLP